MGKLILRCKQELLSLLHVRNRRVNEIPSLRDHSLFIFNSTWLLEQNTLDQVANFTASTRPSAPFD